MHYTGDLGIGYGCTYDTCVFVDSAGVNVIKGNRLIRATVSHWPDVTAADQLSDHYANNEDAQVDSANNYAGAALNGRLEAAQNALVDAGVIRPSDVAHEVTSMQNSAYTQAQVEGWFPDGKFPTQEQYNAMSTDDRNALRNALMTIVGDRKLNDTTNYEQTYQGMFSNYFEKRDGDGN